MEPKFHIAELNELPAGTLTELFTECLAVPGWARDLAAGRPYPDTESLLARADELSAHLTDADLRRALADHPRIGERTAGRPAAEQSGVDSSFAARFADANAAYERRFGHIYLVAAAGRTGDDLLADLDRRMGNDPATEWGVVRRELGRIARLRLSGMIDT